MKEPGEGGVIVTAIVQDFADLDPGNAEVGVFGGALGLPVRREEEPQGFIGGAIDLLNISEGEIVGDAAVGERVWCGGLGVSNPAGAEAEQKNEDVFI